MPASTFGGTRSGPGRGDIAAAGEPVCCGLSGRVRELARSGGCLLVGMREKRGTVEAGEQCMPVVEARRWLDSPRSGHDKHVKQTVQNMDRRAGSGGVCGALPGADLGRMAAL